jgi:hypothetical protein
MYNMRGTGIQVAALLASTVSISNLWLFSSIFVCTMVNGTISGVVATGSSNPLQFTSAVNSGLVVSDLTSHSNSASGISISNNSLFTTNFSNITVWRNTTRGIQISGATNVFIDGVVAFGNATNGVEISTSALISIINGVFNGGTTLVQPVGITFAGGNTQVTVDNSTFGATTTHTTGDLNISTNRLWCDAVFTNCLFSSTTELSNQDFLAYASQIGSAKHDQTNAAHRTWRRTGTISYDGVISASPSSSQRVTPNISTTKIQTLDRKFSIPSGKTATVLVSVRRSVAGDGTAYNGSLPRLWLRSNNSAGITTNTLLATATAASSGAFEILTGTIPAATDNTINEIYIDLDGTTGWVNIDQWKLDIVNGSANSTPTNFEDFWNDGTSFQSVNTGLFNNSGIETYWKNGAPATELFPVSSALTGRFFLVFEEG